MFLDGAFKSFLVGRVVFKVEYKIHTKSVVVFLDGAFESFLVGGIQINSLWEDSTYEGLGEGWKKLWSFYTSPPNA